MQVILGAGLVALSFIPYLAPIAPFLRSTGIAMIVGGVAGMLSSPPDPSVYGDGEAPKSYLFGGSNQSTMAGGPVPVLYGRLEIPGVLISGGIVPEPMATSHFGLRGDGLGNWSGDGLTVPLAASIAMAGA